MGWLVPHAFGVEDTASFQAIRRGSNFGGIWLDLGEDEVGIQSIQWMLVFDPKQADGDSDRRIVKPETVIFGNWNFKHGKKPDSQFLTLKCNTISGPQVSWSGRNRLPQADLGSSQARSTVSRSPLKLKISCNSIDCELYCEEHL